MIINLLDIPNDLTMVMWWVLQYFYFIQQNFYNNYY